MKNQLLHFNSIALATAALSLCLRIKFLLQPAFSSSAQRHPSGIAIQFSIGSQWPRGLVVQSVGTRSSHCYGLSTRTTRDGILHLDGKDGTGRDAHKPLPSIQGR